MVFKLANPISDVNCTNSYTSDYSDYSDSLKDSMINSPKESLSRVCLIDFTISVAISDVNYTNSYTSDYSDYSDSLKDIFHKLDSMTKQGITAEELIEPEYQNKVTLLEHNPYKNNEKIPTKDSSLRAIPVVTDVSNIKQEQKDMSKGYTEEQIEFPKSNTSSAARTDRSNQSEIGDYTTEKMTRSGAEAGKSGYSKNERVVVLSPEPSRPNSPSDSYSVTSIIDPKSKFSLNDIGEAVSRIEQYKRESEKELEYLNLIYYYLKDYKKQPTIDNFSDLFSLFNTKSVGCNEAVRLALKLQGKPIGKLEQFLYDLKCLENAKQKKLIQTATSKESNTELKKSTENIMEKGFASKNQDLFVKKYGFKADLPEDFVSLLCDLSLKYESQITIPSNPLVYKNTKKDLVASAKQISDKIIHPETKETFVAAILKLVIAGWVEFLFVYKELFELQYSQPINCSFLLPKYEELQKEVDYNIHPFLRDLGIDLHAAGSLEKVVKNDLDLAEQKSNSEPINALVVQNDSSDITPLGETLSNEA